MKNSLFALFAFGILISIGFTSQITLAQPQQTPPPICDDKTDFKNWDFWLGNWDVYAYPDGETLQGTNSIEKIATGCAILETWVSPGGGGGSSINHYNPATEKWRQVWIGGGPGYLIEIEGAIDEKDGSMFLEGLFKILSMATKLHLQVVGPR